MILNNVSLQPVTNIYAMYSGQEIVVEIKVKLLLYQSRIIFLDVYNNIF